MEFSVRTIAVVVLASLTGCKKPPPAVRGDASQPTVVVHGDAGREPCSIIPEDQRDLVVAQVGTEKLTVCDFVKHIQSQDQYLRQRLNAPEPRRKLLEAWVDSELLAAEARARGLDTRVQVRRAVVTRLAEELQNQVRATVTPPTVTDAEVETYYNAHKADYAAPEQVRLSHVVLNDRVNADRVLALAKGHATDDSYWRELAKRESADPASRDVGGDVGYTPIEGNNLVAPEVAKAAFALTTAGQIADQVIASAHGGPHMGPAFHIVRFVARRAAVERTLAEVGGIIRTELLRTKFDEAQGKAIADLLAEIAKTTPVTVDEVALASVHLDLPPVAVDAGTARMPLIAPVPARVP